MKMNGVKGLAALAMTAVLAGCHKFDTIEQYRVSEEEALANAELALGFEIDPNQSWNMTQTATVKVCVKLGVSSDYTVGVYDENPINNSDAHYYKLMQVTEGGSESATITIPSATKKLYFVAYDSQKRSLVRTAEVKNGICEMAFDKDEAAKAPRRAIESVFEFPSAPDDSEFATATDVTGERLTGYQAAENFYIDAVSATSGNKLQPWFGWPAQFDHINIYVKESVTLTGTDPVYFPNDVTIYLINGVTFTFPEDYNYNLEQSNDVMYIDEGATLVINGTLAIGSNCKLYNRGTIIADEIIVRNGGILYNEGTIDMSEKSSGEISVTNNNSVIVNDGNMIVTRMHVAGSGHVQNNGTFESTGNTDIDSNNATWVNNGTYTTDYFNYTAGSVDVINNCRLYVNEDFNINLGDTPSNGFRNDAGASVVTKNFNGGGSFTGNVVDQWGQSTTKNFTGGPFFIYLGTGAVFRVTETATMSATKADYGIYGPESGTNAVFQAKDITCYDAAQGYNVTYGNNLNVICETHFDSDNNFQGTDGQYPFIDFKGNATINMGSNQPLIDLPETECAPAINGGGGGQINGTPNIYSYAFEDTKLGDYDLNDVVIKVQENEDGEHLDLKVVASGATLNLNIRLYPAATVPDGVVAVYPEEEEGFEVLKYTRDGVECDEVHAMLGVDPGTMVNTGWGNNKARPITIQIPKGDYDPAHLPLAIYSVAQGEVRLSGSGTAPYGVVIPKNWSWPYERNNVHRIYNATDTTEGDQSFETFSSQAGQAESWYDHPTGDVLNETTLGF